ncbi:hypothetical protein [Polyangium aurulentum]|uniref:hypothetical protein n=1 Tax=Polyangium aurulentum TaxID=2567896 RepID=UPI0010AE5D97|nr:hypothetical protein [Polyangium aurulentum]UQA59084.1 hypothetical protein E8A73_000780 [Polyangium aurulentum]
MVVPLAAVGALAMLGACVERFDVTYSGSGGGASSSASSGTGGGTGGAPASSSSGVGGGKTCTMAAECGDICGTPACTMGMCEWTNPKPDGSPDLFTQVYGDCKELQCQDGQAVERADNSDKYDWSNECFTDDCYTDMPAVKTGAACTPVGGGSGKCSQSGVCLRCLVDTDCSGGAKCSAFGKCLAASCSNLAKDGTETDVDCGGSCDPCGETKACNSAGDCKDRGVCKGNPKVCFVADCFDGAPNQDETDVDCGGICAETGMGPNNGKCEGGQKCLFPSDCLSNNCVAGVCK